MEKNNLENNNVKSLDGTIESINGKIFVKNPVGHGEYAKINVNNDCKLFINGKEIKAYSIVKESDEIIIEKEVKGKRYIDILPNEDKTEVRINIRYETGFKYKIKDSKRSKNLNVDFNEIKGEFTPLFTSNEIIKYLNENKIIMGLNREAIFALEEKREVNNLCIAKSTPAIEPVQDKIKMIYSLENNDETLDSIKNIDYKNIISVKSVKNGDVIAEIIKGSIGKDGITVYGKKIKAKLLKELRVKIGTGCKLEGNKIIATIDGKPSTINNNFKVNKLYNVNGDVDIESGNINFLGDVNVIGKVTEGMSVMANTVNIKGGSFKANIKANNSSAIFGNIFASEIKIGGQDLLRQNKIQQIILLKEQLESLVSNIKLLKDRNLIDERISDGNLIKTLIESKYKTIPKICTSIVSLEIASMEEESKLTLIIKSKLTGFGLISIKKYTEIEDVVKFLEEERENLQMESSLESDLIMEYCQESSIEVNGKVLIDGKGCYTSKIFSLNSIEFIQDNAICRGGHLKATNFIKLKTVGSTVGVETNVEVEKNGHIYADIAYQNTVFIVGKRKHVLLKHSKNLHVYIGRDGEIVVDKLNL